jgi:phospho-2-dehydro-3-deoxyheptonate aldolase
MKDLRYGISITDSCIGWETTERMLLWGHDALEKTIPAKIAAI